MRNWRKSRSRRSRTETSRPGTPAGSRSSAAARAVGQRAVRLPPYLGNIDHPRRGCRPAYHNARAEGWEVNHEKIQCLRRYEGLRVPQRRRHKGHGSSTAPPTVIADASNRVWAVDFQFDVTTGECLGGMVERSNSGEHLIGELGRLATERDTFPSSVLQRDRGFELACRAMADYKRPAGTHRWAINFAPAALPSCTHH